MSFSQKGWVKFEADPRLNAWVAAAEPEAIRVAQDPKLKAEWLRCDGTWFVGVNALCNDTDGGVGGVALAGQAVDFIHDHILPAPITWDRAQVSICYQGYPKRSKGETEAAYRFRRDRDAAHVDGLHGEGTPKRRHLREFHQFLLGIALSDSPVEAAPFVIWEGSHHLVQTAFAKALAPYPEQDWPEVDLAAVNMQVRREIFETCRRVELPLKKGESYVIHRHALHGVAPWNNDVAGPKNGRVIAYFRPEDQTQMAKWLSTDARSDV